VFPLRRSGHDLEGGREPGSFCVFSFNKQLSAEAVALVFAFVFVLLNADG
jgi:hypothetical protein